MTAYGVTATGFVTKPVTQIQTEIEQDQLDTIDPQLDTSPDQALGQMNGILAEKLGELWELAQVAYASISRDDAEGAQLDNVGALTGSTRLAPKQSFVFCNCTLLAANSPYAEGSLVANVSGQPTIQFANSAIVTVAADGVVSVLFNATVNGPTIAAAGTLTQITAPVTGWSAVTNPHDATLGNFEEDDQDFRARQELEIAAAGSGTVDAIRADLLESVPGIISANVVENTTFLTDAATGTPPRSLQAIVWDGPGLAASNDGIAQSLWDHKPAGTPYVGNSLGNATDAEGILRSVPFTRPTQRSVWLAFTVAFTPGLSPALQTTAIAGVKAAAVAYGAANLSPGVAVLSLALRAAALQTPGIYNVPALALDFAASPTATADLTIGATQVAVLDTSRITVNGL